MRAEALSSVTSCAFQMEVTMANLSTKDRDDVSMSYSLSRSSGGALENASHPPNAVARFNQVKGVSDHERDDA